MCWYCGSPVTDSEPIGRSLKCQDCGKDLRACKNCRFFLSSGGASALASGDCRESSAELQSDRERSNFCDWFSLEPKLRSKTAGQSNERQKADASRTALENLFN